MKRRHERNYPLLVGTVIIGLALLVSVIGPSIAPHDPMEAFNKVMKIDGKTVIPNRRPIPPLKMPGLFLLGTDDVARDLYSRILYAFRPTLLLCAVVVVVRMALGLPLGLAAGWYGRIPGRAVEVLISASMAVPTLVFAVAAISLLGDKPGLVPFIIALCLTGWAEVANYVRSQTAVLAQAPFIESARATGVRPRSILGRHILPQLWPVLPALIAHELSSVLLVVAELGFLGVYIGGGYLYEVAKGDSAGTWLMLTEGYPELAQMLSKIWTKLLLVPWEPLIVGTIIFLIILGFNLLGEGLRRRMDITRRHVSRS